MRLIASMRFIAFFAAIQGFSAAMSLDARVEVPAGVSPASVRAYLAESLPGDVENDPSAAAQGPAFPVNERGEIKIACEPTTRTQIEFVGRGVRRARFPWPKETPGQPNRRAVFRLAKGAAMTILVKDAETGKPLPDVLIGPVVPEGETASDMLHHTYAFFARTNAGGKADIEGILEEAVYIVPFYKEGWIRGRDSLRPGAEYTIELRRGGLSLSGTAMGDRTGKPFPGIPITLTGGPKNFLVKRQTDASGSFAFSGLPEGTFSLAPVVPETGDTREAEFSVFGAKSLDKIRLMVPEGVMVSGIVMDVESGEPIGGSWIEWRGHSARTSDDGRFEMGPMRGPWPAEMTAEHPAYRFERADQPAETYPINGFEGNDIADAALKLRRKRFLEIKISDALMSPPLALSEAPADIRKSAEAQNRPAPRKKALAASKNPDALADRPAARSSPGMLSVWGPLEQKVLEARRERLTSWRAITPLESAGTRMAWLRSPNGNVSELVLVKTDFKDTTSTIEMAPAPGARIEGSLTYREGPPAPQFEFVLATDLNGSAPAEIMFIRIRSTAEGRFHIPELPPGDYSARFLAAAREERILLEEKIALRRGEALNLDRQIDRGLVLAGRVLDPEGKPALEMPVVIYGKDPAGQAVHFQVMSREGGAFRFEGLGGPTLDELSIAHHQYAPFKLANIPLPNENLEIKLQPKNGIIAEVEAPGDALNQGRVLLLVSRRRSVENVPDQWYSETDEQAALAGESRVTMTPNSLGRIRVAALAGGQWDVSSAFDWNENAETKTVRLSPGAKSSLIVKLQGIESEKAAEALEVTLLNTTLPEGETAVSFTPSQKTPQRLVFENLPAGDYLLLASSKDMATAYRSNLDIVSGRNLEIEWALSGAAPEVEIRGAVVLASRAEDSKDGENQGKKPVSGAKVILYFGDIPEPEALADDVTDASGEFRFAGLPGGRPYLVRASHGSLSDQAMVPASKDGKQPARAIIVLQAPISVRFTMSDTLRTRAQTSPGAPFLFQQIDGNAAATLPPDKLEAPVSLPPGRYRVAWGETPVGEIEIPGGAQEVEVPLPEIP